MIIREYKKSDLEQIKAIKNYYIEHTDFSLEYDLKTDEEMEAWHKEHDGIYPVFVYEEDGKVLGYASLSLFRGYIGYRKTAEVSIFVSPDLRSRGVGSSLMKRLIDEAKKYDFHNLVSVITAINHRSINFHEKMGFKMSGELPEAGYKNGRFLGVCFMYKIIE